MKQLNHTLDLSWTLDCEQLPLSPSLSRLSYLLLAYKVQKILGVHRARVMMLILGLIFL